MSWPMCTVNHFICEASKFGDFKRLTYCHILNLAVSQMPNVICCSHMDYFLREVTTF